MKIVDARQTLKEVEDKSYTYLGWWGLSTIKESVRTIYNRDSSTQHDKILAEKVSLVISGGRNIK